MTASPALDLLERIARGDADCFAIMQRGPDTVDIVIGEARVAPTLEQLLRSHDAGSGVARASVVVVPYVQVAERGFRVTPDDTPLVAIDVDEHAQLASADLVAQLPDVVLDLRREGFDVSDDDYAAMVRDVIRDEIGTGEGANFVMHRSYRGRLGTAGPVAALTLLRRLLTREEGAHWTFAIGLPDRFLVGASPEVHIALDRDRTLRMNPISGTVRYGPDGPRLADTLAFLDDTKEREELFMVVDEELKIMSRLCAGSPRVRGPYLREMSHVAHTEYFIEGRCEHGPARILAESLLAPTVTGSPLENACRVIARHEPTNRQYYSGVAAFVQTAADGSSELDSTILIRTADISRDGAVRVPVGATLVRHSDPVAEVAETAAKARGLLHALELDPVVPLAAHPDVVRALRARNAGLARYWFDDAPTRPGPSERSARVLVCDYEDRFTDMLGSQLAALGLTVVPAPQQDLLPLEGIDLVMLGPGPGDPADLSDARIARLHSQVRQTLRSGLPFIAICLSHQALSLALGLSLRQLPEPNQGTQCAVDLFGERVHVAMYNTYTAVSSDSELPTAAGSVHVATMPGSHDVVALRGPRFETMQFHPESLLSADGHRVLGAVCERLLAQPRPGAADLAVPAGEVA